MAIQTSTMGWAQVLGGLLALWFAWKGDPIRSVAVIGLVLVFMGYHHIKGKGHKAF